MEAPCAYLSEVYANCGIDLSAESGRQIFTADYRRFAGIWL